MRTTITIADELLDRLKMEAAHRGTTVSKLVEECVRLAEKQAVNPEPEPFELVTFGSGGRSTRFDVDDTSGLQELDDLERIGALDS